MVKIKRTWWTNWMWVWEGGAWSIIWRCPSIEWLMGGSAIHWDRIKCYLIDSNLRKRLLLKKKKKVSRKYLCLNILTSSPLFIILSSHSNTPNTNLILTQWWILAWNNGSPIQSPSLRLTTPVLTAVRYSPLSSTLPPYSEQLLLTW